MILWRKKGLLKRRVEILLMSVPVTIYSVIIIAFDSVNLASAKLPPFITQLPECKPPCSVAIQNSSGASNEIDCNFVKDTFECEKRTRSLGDNSSVNLSSSSIDWSKLTCKLSQVRVNLTPYSFEHSSTYPILSLNISMMVTDPLTRAAAIRLICVESGAEKEFFCENRTRPAHWDRFYWPCRLYDFWDIANSGHSLIFPLTFNHDCFRLGALSSYMVNVTLYPQHCTAAYVFRMPSLANVVAKSVTSWLPLVSVDTNADDGVWVRFSPAPQSMRIRRTVVEIYEILYDHDELERGNSAQMGRSRIRHKLCRNETVPAPNISVFVVDLPRASYLAVVYALHSSCDEEKCLRMQVSFNLTKNHYTIFKQCELELNSALQNASTTVAVAVVSVIVIFAAGVAAVVAYLRWKAAKRRRQEVVSFVQFTRSPVVLIVYTNDFGFHLQSVLELATYLRSRANCEVEIDEWELCSAGKFHRTPAEWLVNAFQRADYYILVFSDGAKETVFRPVDSDTFVELRRERPWDEPFAPAVNLILQRTLQNARSVDPQLMLRQNGPIDKRRPAAPFDRIVCVRFSYSLTSAVPDLFQTLPCPKFTLPDDLRRLICYIHEFADDSIYEDSPLDADRLCSVASEASRFIEKNPDWLRSRLVERRINESRPSELSERQKLNDISTAIDRLHEPAVNEIPENLEEFYAGMVEEQNRNLESGVLGVGEMDDKYMLLPPSATVDEPQEAASTSRFELLPPDDEELASLFYSGSNSKGK